MNGLLFLLVAAAGPPGAVKLPPRAVARLGDYRFYHGPGLWCAALSPDGRQVATVARAELPHFEYDRTIILWDTASGRRLRTWKAPARAHDVRYSPDGKLIAVAADYQVVLFDAETGKVRQQIRTGAELTLRAHFSADGRELFVNCWRDGALVLDVATGKPVARLKRGCLAGSRKRPDRVDDCIISPDGKWAAWLLSREDDFSRLPARGSIGMQFYPPTALVVVGLRSGKVAYRREFFEGQLDGFQFVAGGRLFLVNPFSVHDTATGAEFFAGPWRKDNLIRGVVGEVPGIASRVRSLWRHIGRGLSADGSALALTTENRPYLIGLPSGVDQHGPRHRWGVQAHFSADGKNVLTTCAEYRCRWSVNTGRRKSLVSVAPAERTIVQGLPRSPEGRLVVQGREDGLAVHLAGDGGLVCKLEKAGKASSGLFSPDGGRLMLFWSGLYMEPTIGLFDARTGKRTGTFTINDADYIGHPVFSPDGRLLAWMGSDGTIRLHASVGGHVVRTLLPDPGPRQDRCEGADLLFSPDGELLAATGNHTDSDGSSLFVARPHRTCIYHIPSGRRVACWYANPEKAGRAGRLACWAWSPDGRLLAVAEEHSRLIRLVEAATGATRATFDGHREGVLSLVFSPGGKLLVSGGQDGVAYLWDVAGPATRLKTKPGKRELEAWWADLGRGDGECAAGAIANLAAAPEAAVAFLKGRLRPALAPSPRRLERLIAGLSAEAFDERDTATRELTRLGVLAEAALDEALQKADDLETRYRIKQVFAMNRAGPHPDTLRALRAVEALERIGTPEAARCVAELAKGAAQARLTVGARAALRRMNRGAGR